MRSAAWVTCVTLALCSAAVADPLVIPSTRECVVVELLNKGRVTVRHRLWLDAAGRPIFMDHTSTSEKTPSHVYAWTYDARGFLATSAGAEVTSDATVTRYSYGSHGELLEVVNPPCGRPPCNGHDKLTWKGT